MHIWQTLQIVGMVVSLAASVVAALLLADRAGLTNRAEIVTNDLKTARLEEEIVAYRDALKQRTRERLPLDWAATQNHLGNALSTLGARENNTARLEEAVAAYSDALKERTRDRVPFDWAVSLGNQGVAMIMLAGRTRNTTMAEIACHQIEMALGMVRSYGHAPFAAQYQSRLHAARRIRDDLIVS
jgi:tetratricopeptide (TPR) repeat protein